MFRNTGSGRMHRNILLQSSPNLGVHSPVRGGPLGRSRVHLPTCPPALLQGVLQKPAVPHPARGLHLLAGPRVRAPPASASTEHLPSPSVMRPSCCTPGCLGQGAGVFLLAWRPASPAPESLFQLSPGGSADWVKSSKSWSRGASGFCRHM